MNTVRIYEETILIPTYGTGEPDPNPMFYENRVYQGSSGKVYPFPIIDKIQDTKQDKEYHVVWLENDYLKVMIMPELGGRIQRAIDKTNGYDFIYYNQVIKPALVGLAGPWISGGIEFNWPQHHRPSTFTPVDYFLEENEDGSATLWLNEIDRMYGTKALMGITLRAEHAYIEIKGQLYNPTDLPQTFLWWANPAVAVHDDTKSIFPLDVRAVMDHGKRDVSEFPIAKGMYYKVDYSPGTDISRYKNIPVPTSYMAYHSDYDFIGNYDFKQQAGMLHVANHHVSPGKKQWTWGHGEFGQAWDRHLTDEDGPYIELMTGMFTDNQPDFSWLEPGEEKTFTQYFMPYKGVGEVSNATKDLVMGVSFKEDAIIRLYASTILTDLTVSAVVDDVVVWTQDIDILSPQNYHTLQASIGTVLPTEIQIQVHQHNKLLLSYKQANNENLDIPDPAQPSAKPEDIATTEELYLTGQHLEQYRHATYRPDPYYLEGLRRDPKDSRINDAYGLLLYRRGLFQESEQYFRTSIERITWKNPNPSNSDPYYHLGLSMKMQGKLDEAFDAFYKSIWNESNKSRGYYQLAAIATIKRKYREALDLVERSLVFHVHHLKARNLKAMLLRKTNQPELASNLLCETARLDPLDYASRYERYLLDNRTSDYEAWKTMMRNEVHNYLELVGWYLEIGEYQEVVDILLPLLNDTSNPLLYYYTGYAYTKLGQNQTAKSFYQKAEQQDPRWCFPNRLQTILVLNDAIESLEDASYAKYFLGNLYYDKRVYDPAIKLWEESRDKNPDFPTVHRNLGLAYYNKKQDIEQAIQSYETAFQLDPTDSRILYELDQLYKRTNHDPSIRLERLKHHMSLVHDRDDLFVEYVQLLNQTNQPQTALNLLLQRPFHVWEGGEGRVIEQYVLSLKLLALDEIKQKFYTKAIEYLTRAKSYPRNLGEGKLFNAQENDLDFLIGHCYEHMNNELAQEFFERASTGSDELSDAMFYNDTKPDSLFFQGLAHYKLGHPDRSKTLFLRLLDYGQTHLHDHVEVDYFAVSLPNFLIFGENLLRRNQTHCNYLMALAHVGLGDWTKARTHLDNLKRLDINHLGAQFLSELYVLK